MELIGTINFDSEMNDARWDSLIASHKELAATESIESTNPFTGEPSTIVAPDQLATVTIGGKSVGALRWAKHGSGIDVFGDTKKMQKFVDSLVAELNGSYDPMPE
jgi:hypothetical protein